MVNLAIYTSEYRISVEKFLEQAANATMFHYPHFFDYHSPEKLPKEFFIANHLIFLQEQKIVAFIAGFIQIENENMKVYKTPCMASYGGLVIDKSIRYKDLESIFEVMMNYFKEANINRIDFTPIPPVMYLNVPEKNSYIEYLLLKYNFLPIQSDLVLSHKINLNSPLEKQINNKTHTELKQAFKNNLSFEITEGIDSETYSLLMYSQERLQSKPTHTFEDLQRLITLFPNTIYQLKVKRNEKIVSGIIAFRYNQNVLNTFYIFDNEEGRNLKANHFAYYQLIHWANHQNYTYVDFGPSTFGYIAHNSLIDFKEKWACLPSQRTKYQLLIK